MHPEWQCAVDSAVFHYLEEEERIPEDTSLSDFSIPLDDAGNVNEELLDTDLISVEEVEEIMDDMEDSWRGWASNDGYYEKVTVKNALGEHEVFFYKTEDRTGFHVSDEEDWFRCSSTVSYYDAYERCLKEMKEAGFEIEGEDN